MNRPCNTHELKIAPRWFNDVQSGRKNFEIRRNDRDFNNSVIATISYPSGS